MKLWELFITFLKIGAVSFGGGYAMIPFFEKEIAIHNWAPYKDYEKVIALAQMIPGPFAIDSSAYIGFRVYGLLGAFVASVALTLPSFIALTFVAKYYIRFKSNRYIQLALTSVRPAVLGLLISAAYIIGIQPLMPTVTTQNLLLLIKPVLVIGGGFLLLKYTKINPMVFIGLSAVTGILLF